MIESPSARAIRALGVGPRKRQAQVFFIATASILAVPPALDLLRPHPGFELSADDMARLAHCLWIRAGSLARHPHDRATISRIVVPDSRWV
jgi:hypothetical protein